MYYILNTTTYIIPHKGCIENNAMFQERHLVRRWRWRPLYNVEVLRYDMHLITLYHVAIKAGVYSKAVQLCYIPNTTIYIMSHKGCLESNAIFQERDLVRLWRWRPLYNVEVLKYGVHLITRNILITKRQNNDSKCASGLCCSRICFINERPRILMTFC